MADAQSVEVPMRKDEILEINMGPQHPSTHGVLRLIVELDGDSHAGNEDYDKIREEVFRSLGYRVIRFWNTEVFEEQENVLETIYNACVEGARANPLVSHKVDQMGQFAACRRSEA